MTSHLTDSHATGQRHIHDELFHVFECILACKCVRVLSLFGSAFGIAEGVFVACSGFVCFACVCMKQNQKTES